MIRKLTDREEPPMALLLLADPAPLLVKQYLSRGDCHIAILDGRIVGEYVLLPTRPDIVELVNVAVIEDKQGEGLGKRLVLHAIETAKASGYKTIEIGTGNSSIAQLALYQKCGFRIVGIDQDFFVRHYPEKIIENEIWCRDMIRLSQDL